MTSGWLLDTNVVSELRKGSRANLYVQAWARSVHEPTTYLSALVLGEVRSGIERTRRRDEAFAAQLEAWLAGLEVHFAHRILPVDVAVAQCWGRFNAQRTVAAVDGLLAATALVHGLTLATRNLADVHGLGVPCVDPFVP